MFRFLLLILRISLSISRYHKEFAHVLCCFCLQLSPEHERGLVANRVVGEEGRYDYDHKSEDENTRKE
jgi:hypothetical protein